MTDAAEGRGAFTILIVEDDSAVKSLIATALKVQGYRLLEASAGKARPCWRPPRRTPT